MGGGSNGVLRVDGNLAVTRSIGDKGMKGISAEPDLLFIRLNGSLIASAKLISTCNVFFTSKYQAGYWALHQFLIVASDGLWDVISNDDAVSIVCSHFHELLKPDRSLPPDAFQNAAQLLAQEAYVRGSNDNIGVCIVDISDGNHS